MKDQSESADGDSGSSGVTSVGFDGFCPASIEEALRLPTVEHVQLAPGRFRGRLMHAELGASSVDWASYDIPLLARGEMHRDTVTLGFVLDVEEPGWLNGHEISAPTLVAYAESAEFHFRVARGFQGLSIQLPREQAERNGLEIQDCGVAVLSAEPRRGRGVGRELAAVLEGLRGIALATPEIPDALACLRQIESHLLDLFTASAADVPTSRARRALHPARQWELVSRATDFMYAHIGEPLRVGDVCRVIGCDWKALERAFLAVNGTTPKRFLTMARLSMARRMLLAAPPDATVTGVASSCGIHHLGRFSTVYRQMFGEAPSRSLARRIRWGSSAMPGAPRDHVGRGGHR